MISLGKHPASQPSRIRLSLHSNNARTPTFSTPPLPRLRRFARGLFLDATLREGAGSG